MRGKRLSTTVALLLGAYVYGSIPVIYVLGRLRQVDLRQIGSGNVGATNLSRRAGLLPAVVGWSFDASKGWLPVSLARWLGIPPSVHAYVGMAGIAGQCWPVFLRFSGGRGISSFVGAAIAIEPVAGLASTMPMAAGGLWRVTTAGSGRSRSVPLGSLLSLLMFPLACAARRRPVAGAAVLSSMLVLRRLTAPLPDDAVHGPAEDPKALWFRLLYDRNTER